MTILEGLTVVSLEQAVAAPLATRHLADLGARVIKIERPRTGDFARGYDEAVEGQSAHFVWLNRSKESVVLDLKHPQGSGILRRLVAQADIFVQNLAPGAAERLGLGADDLRERQPELIHASISGYGADGPYASRKAYDLLVQCEAGLVSVTGTPESPAKVGIPIADIAAGMYAYSGILTALVRRLRTGAGATLTISMLEALSEWMGFPYYYATYGGSAPARAGTNHASIAPYGPFACGDGEVVFLAVQNEPEWHRLCSQVLRRPDLAADPRFATNSLRVAHREELHEHIEVTCGRHDSATLETRLDEAGIASARLRDISTLAHHPQLKARGRWHPVTSGEVTVQALLPPGLPEGDAPVMGPVPRLGEHTDAVLAEFAISPPDLPVPPTERS